ncbi:MAG: DUF1566 domain-containing protein [Proteobacteria bacterium]|nr:DUF1566 domain-containing protein [Pseudomonadota bacterium]
MSKSIRTFKQRWVMVAISFCMLCFMTVGCTSSESSETEENSTTHVASADTTTPTAGNAGLIVATPTQDSVDLAWTAGTDNVTSANELVYMVFYSTVQVDVETLATLNNSIADNGFTAALTSKTVSGLTANTTYFFNVVVKDAAGNETLYTFKEAKTLDDTAPVVADPTITVTGAPDDTLGLAWTAATDTLAVSYKIYYSTSNGMDTVANIETNGTLAKTVAEISTTLIGVPRDLMYFNVVAVDADGNTAAYTMTTVDNKQELSGTVVDGYIANAMVCFDKNDNAACDAGEPFAKTDASGDYQRLNIPEGELSELLVPTLIIEGGTDISSGKPFLGLLQAPILPGLSVANITPLTGLLTAKLKTVGGEITTADIDGAKNEIANTLGLSNVDITDDPIEAARNNIDGKELLKKTLQVQKMIEIIAAAEQDQSDGGSVEERKRAKTRDVMAALASRMDVEDGGTARSFEGIIDDMTTDTEFQHLSHIKDALMTVNESIDSIFVKAEDVGGDIDDTELQQIGAVANRVAGDVEQAIDTVKQGGNGNLSNFDVDTIIDYDVSGDAFLKKLDVETLISMLGLSVGAGDATGDTELTQQQWDDITDIISADSYDFNAQTSVEDFWQAIKDESSFSFTNVKLKFETAFDSYQLKYPKRLEINNEKRVSLEGQTMKYFTIYIDEAGEYDFVLTRMDDDSTTDLSSVDLFSLHENETSESDFDRPAATEMVVTDQSGTGVRLLSTDVSTAGTYWLKIQNDISVSFNLIAKKHVAQRGLNLQMYLDVGDYDPEAHTFTNKAGGVEFNDCAKYRFFPEEGESFETVSLTNPAGVENPMEFRNSDDFSYYQFQNCGQGNQYPASGYYTVTVTVAGEDPEERYFYMDIPNSVADIEVPEVEVTVDDASGNIVSFGFSNVTLDDPDEVGVSFEGEDHSQLGGHYPLTEESTESISITDSINTDQVHGIHFNVGHPEKRIGFVYQWNISSATREISMMETYRGLYLRGSDQKTLPELNFNGWRLRYEIKGDIGPETVTVTIDGNDSIASKMDSTGDDYSSYESTSDAYPATNEVEVSVMEADNAPITKTFNVPAQEDVPMPILEYTTDDDGKIATVTLSGSNLPTEAEFMWHLALYQNSTYVAPIVKVSSEDSIQIEDGFLEDYLNEIVCRLEKDGIQYEYRWKLASSNLRMTAFKFEANNNTAIGSDVEFDIDQGTRFINATVSDGTDVASLVPTFEFQGKSVSIDSVAQESGVTAQDFSSYQIYRVTAEDNGTLDYVVAVNIDRSASGTVSLNGMMWQNGSLPSKKNWTDAGTYCEELTYAGSDDWQLPSDSQLRILFVNWVYNLVNLTSHQHNQNYWTSTMSGSYPGDMRTYDTGSVKTVGSLQPRPETYENYVRCVRNVLPTVSSFKFLKTDNNALDEDVEGTINNTTINVTLPGLTDASALVATVETSPASTVEINKVVQTSGVTASDFNSGDVIYTLVTADNQVRNYKVVVTFEFDKPKITAFKFLAADNDGLEENANGTITTGYSPEIQLDVPFGTGVRELIATFTTVGAYGTPTVSKGYSELISGETSENYSYSVTLVVADDYSSVNYKVIVNVNDPEGVEASGQYWWQLGPYEKKNRTGAFAYCQSLVIGTFTNWKLPSIQDYQYNRSMMTSYAARWVSDSPFWSSGGGGVPPVHYEYPTAQKSMLGVSAGDAGSATATVSTRCIHNK